jgi:hypothetical protein
MDFFSKGAFTPANFARDFALSLHVLLNKIFLFSLLNVKASAKSRAKSRQCKRTLNSLIFKLFLLLRKGELCLEGQGTTGILTERKAQYS